MRLDQLIQQHKTENDQLDIEMILCETKEQAEHPERFKRVLVDEKIVPTGFDVRMYHLEPKIAIP